MALQISNIEKIYSFFNNYFNTIKKNIYDLNIKNSYKISYKIKNNMMIIFNDFVKNPTKDELFNNCRSIILTSTSNEESKYKIVAFTHPIVDYNNYGKLNDIDCDSIIGLQEREVNLNKFVECYEGSLISVYYCNDKWNYSTRKCLDAKDSYWAYNGKFSENSHYDMFIESLGQSQNDFELKLDKTKSYYFVLVHYQNKTFIDYTNKFGSEYKKAFLLFIRDENMNQVLENPDNLKEYIDSNDKLSSVEIKNRIETDVNIMGYLLNKDGQFYVYHTKFYENLEKAAPYSYSYENMLLELYKRDNLDLNFKMYPENIKYRDSTFDTKGVIFGVFTYLSMTLLNVYYHFTAYDGVKLIHKNEVDFKLLFDDNKNNTLQALLYKMKGMVLSQKKKLELSDVRKMIKYYINSPDLTRCLKELEEIKKIDKTIFIKMNPKYKDNAIINNFISYI